MYQNDLIYTIDSHSQSDAARRPLPSPSLGFLYRARYGSSGIPVLVRASEPGVPAGFMARRLETHYRAALAAGSSATPSPLYLGPYENGIILVTEDRIEETMAAAMRSGPMQYTEAARWISGCIRSLKALHRGGWIHCSLRPDHIGMDRDGTVLLLGLGSARQVRDVSGEPLDLPDDTYKLGFLAPEQTGRLDRPMDWRTDIFSLGAIMYAALSGKPPFGGQDAPTVLHECIASIPPSLSALRDDIPQFVSDIVSRAMNKNPDRRYRTLSGMQHDMDAVLSGTFSGMQAGQKDHPEDLLAIDTPGKELQFGTMLQWIQETFPDLVPAREQLAGILVAAGVQDSDSLHSYMHKLLAAGDIAYDDPRGAWFFVRPNASGAQSDAALQALLPARLALVDEDTQRFLECASCAGDEFDWQSIAALVRQEAADRILVQAVSAGLIIPSSRGGFSYRFSHPALRKSLYERLESIRKSVWHSAFAERYSSAGRLDLVIPHVLADPLKPRRRDEVIRRAAMFMEAGIALRPHDAEQALLLVSKARTMLGPAGWRDAYRLRLDVCMLFASLCAATGRAAEFDDCAGQMRAEARASNLPAVHRVLILAHSALGRSEEAVAEGRAALRQMGWPMPANPAPLGALVAYLFARSINAINAKLPKPNKPASMKKKIHEALETVLDTGTSAYVSKPTLVPFLVALGLGLAGRNTAYPGLAALYAAMGYIECGLFRNYTRGLRYGKQAESLAALSLAGSRYCQTMLITTGFVTHWHRPIHETLASLLDAARTGKTAGDTEFSSYTYAAYLQHLILEGRSLRLAENSLAEIEPGIRSQGQELPTLVLDANLVLMAQMKQGNYDKNAAVLRGETLAAWQNRMSRFGQHEVVCDLALIRALASCTFGDFTETLSAIREAAPSRAAFAGQLADAVLYFLELVARLRLGEKPGHTAYRTARWLNKLAAINPSVFESKALMARGMLRYRHRGRSAAFDLFDKAISCARANGNLLDEAMACAEYAWRLDKAGSLSQAIFYSIASYEALVRWGAQGAALALSERSQRLKIWIRNSRLQAGGLVGLDAEMVMKALSSMAGELDPKRLATRLLELAQGLTGSRYGCVWVKTGSAWEALASVGRAAGDDLSLLNQAALSLRPVSDNRGPDGSSQTVIPLVSRGRALGALLLGNELVADTFPRERMSAVEIMTMQAAVALDNADLYSSLENKVRERTAELEDALRNVRRLQGLIPICSSCKKVRDDKGYWGQVEEYISARTEADFTHGLCPDCMARYYDELGLPKPQPPADG